MLDYVRMYPGVKGGGISDRFGLSRRTLERFLKELKEDHKIMFKGSKKTGGYYAIESREFSEALK